MRSLITVTLTTSVALAIFIGCGNKSREDKAGSKVTPNAAKKEGKKDGDGTPDGQGKTGPGAGEDTADTGGSNTSVQDDRLKIESLRASSLEGRETCPNPFEDSVDSKDESITFESLIDKTEGSWFLKDLVVMVENNSQNQRSGLTGLGSFFGSAEDLANKSVDQTKNKVTCHTLKKSEDEKSRASILVKTALPLRIDRTTGKVSALRLDLFQAEGSSTKVGTVLKSSNLTISKSTTGNEFLSLNKAEKSEATVTIVRNGKLVTVHARVAMILGKGDANQVLNLRATYAADAARQK